MKYLDTAWSFASTWVTVVFCFLSCVTISYFTLEYTQLFGNRVEQKEIDLWLKENNLFMFKDLYQYRDCYKMTSYHWKTFTGWMTARHISSLAESSPNGPKLACLSRRARTRWVS
uniref:Uncharacterized protein n=1 Tax=Cacopsylla melanoneura TaxID=428564 RepID=A0A8D9E0G7_9HEMI